MRDLFKNLLGFHSNAGTDGIVLVGTTGESATLNKNEKAEIFEFANSNTDIPLMAGVGSSSTTDAIELVECALENDIRECLAVTPYYNKPSQIGLELHYKELSKVGAEIIGNRVRAKIVKNKVAPPFKEAQFDIMFGQGISREGSLVDVGVEHGIVRKAGAWFTYDEIQLGQGKENSKRFLRENVDIALQLETDVYKAVGLIESDESDEEDIVDESEDTTAEK